MHLLPAASHTRKPVAGRWRFAGALGLGLLACLLQALSQHSAVRPARASSSSVIVVGAGGERISNVTPLAA